MTCRFWPDLLGKECGCEASDCSCSRYVVTCLTPSEECTCVTRIEAITLPLILSLLLIITAGQGQAEIQAEELRSRNSSGREEENGKELISKTSGLIRLALIIIIITIYFFFK